MKVCLGFKPIKYEIKVEEVTRRTLTKEVLKEKKKETKTSECQISKERYLRRFEYSQERLEYLSTNEKKMHS